jgi:hypothetical protein
MVSEDLAKDVRSLAVGVRGVVGGFTVMFSVLNVRVALLIPFYHGLFLDALPGKPLPGMTQFVIWARILLLLLAIVLPIAAVVILFAVRNHKVALILATVVMVSVFLQMSLTASSLMSPMMDLMGGMSGMSDQATGH